MADETNDDSYLSVYNYIPDNWEEARQYLTEQLKKICEIVNIREIGWLLDQELISGKQFIPGTGNNQDYRTVFRKVIVTGALLSGVLKSVPHGITFDSSFTLIQMYGAATDTIAFIAEPIPNGTMTVNMDATNVNILPDNNYNLSHIVIEYLLEV